MSNHRSISILALAVFGAGSLPADEAPVKRIRVVLDTSKSLHRTDPSGYVKTATAMLYDLSWQILGVKDTFVIVPFNPNWSEQVDPPETVGSPMTPGRSQSERDKFDRDMLETAYESPQTYFSPGMKWSYNDLEKEGGPNDQKIIVLVTDGLPDKQTIAVDARRLKELVPRLAKSGIKVYVLAFGPEVREEWFEDVFHFNKSDGVIGQLFVGKDASKLLDNMLEIFSKSFGYFRTNLGDLSRIDVSGGSYRERAVVVALYKPDQEPGFQLTTPEGKKVGGDFYKVRGQADRLGRPAPGKPVSYAFQWLHPPEKGYYAFKSTGGVPEQVAVLYPGGFNIGRRAYGDSPLEVVMAGKPAPMEILVTPASGAGDDPGKITVSFHLHYLKKDDSGPAAQVGERGPSPPEGEYVKGVGRVFRIEPQFARDPPGWPEGTAYQGYIDVKVTPLGSNDVLAEKGPNMYPVRVYPYVSLHPTPPDLTLLGEHGPMLRGGDSVCATFHFQLQGNSTDLKERNYTLGARLDPPVELTHEWRGARFRLDDKEMDTASPSGWQSTGRLEPSQINSENHKFCVQVGSPTRGQTDRLKIEFGVWPNTDVIYQRLNVVEPITANISIAAPDFWQLWKPWLLLLLTPFLMFLTYLFWKNRRLLPPDLAVSLASGEGELTRSNLGEESFGSRWLGLPQTRPVLSLTGDKELGSVRPVDEELFLFMPAKGFGLVMEEENGEWRQKEVRGDGSQLLQAGRKYRAGAGKDAHFFRLDYTEARPKI
jgi:hypothetical protein